MRLFVHHGKPKRAGVVLGLDYGGASMGMTFNMLGVLCDEVMAYLRTRANLCLAFIAPPSNGKYCRPSPIWWTGPTSNMRAA